MERAVEHLIKGEQVRNASLVGRTVWTSGLKFNVVNNIHRIKVKAKFWAWSSTLRCSIRLETSSVKLQGTLKMRGVEVRSGQKVHDLALNHVSLCRFNCKAVCREMGTSYRKYFLFCLQGHWLKKVSWRAPLMTALNYCKDTKCLSKNNPQKIWLAWRGCGVTFL